MPVVKPFVKPGVSVTQKHPAARSAEQPATSSAERPPDSVAASTISVAQPVTNSAGRLYDSVAAGVAEKPAPSQIYKINAYDAGWNYTDAPSSRRISAEQPAYTQFVWSAEQNVFRAR
jgi:hypothetical protein